MPSARKAKGFGDWEFPLELDLPRNELGGMSLSQLGTIPFEQLGQFKQAQSFPHGYSRDFLTFYAPRDPGVHQVLMWTLLQAKSSVAINMYGFDDPQLAALLRHHVANPQMPGHALARLERGRRQGGEPELLKLLRNDLPGNSIADRPLRKARDQPRQAGGDRWPLPRHRLDQLVLRRRGRPGQPADPEPRPDRPRRGEGGDRPRPRRDAEADGRKRRRRQPRPRASQERAGRPSASAGRRQRRSPSSAK